MSLQIGDPMRELQDEQISMIHLDVREQLLELVNSSGTGKIASWASEPQPKEYVPEGFSRDDAQLLVANRPAGGFSNLDEIKNVAGIGIEKLSDLVYAASALMATDPDRVLLEDVFAPSAFEAVAELVRRPMQIPDPGMHCTLEVQTAYVNIRGKAKTLEMNPVIRQRSYRETWAELELKARQRLWYMAAPRTLIDEAVFPRKLMLFPRLGGDFLSTPTLTINVDDQIVDVPPVSELATDDHEFYGFPEIEGEMFLLRLEQPPNPEYGENGFPTNPAWPHNYYFHVDPGDILLFGPSYPTDIAVRAGGKEPIYNHGGELTSLARSNDVSADFQTVIDGIRERMELSPAPVSRFTLIATSKQAGHLEVEFEADIHAVVDTFSGGKKSQKVNFDSSQHTAEVELDLPTLGDPIAGTVGIKGIVSSSVIVQELGGRASATGPAKIGVRLIEDVEYTVSFTVAEEFAADAVDIRLMNASSGATLTVQVNGEESSTTATLSNITARRGPGWFTIPLDSPVPFLTELTYTIGVTVKGGSVAWLCGAGEQRYHLRRRERASAPTQVVDVNSGSPLMGQLRLRRNAPLEQPNLHLSLLPGDHEVQLMDVQVDETGWLEATADLLPALRESQERQVTLRIDNKAEGELTLHSPEIRYHFHVETE